MQVGLYTGGFVLNTCYYLSIIRRELKTFWNFFHTFMISISKEKFQVKPPILHSNHIRTHDVSKPIYKVVFKAKGTIITEKRRFIHWAANGICVNIFIN